MKNYSLSTMTEFTKKECISHWPYQNVHSAGIKQLPIKDQKHLAENPHKPIFAVP